MNIPVLNEMLKLRREYVEDLKRNDDRLDVINRLIWDAIIAQENEERQAKEPANKSARKHEDDNKTDKNCSKNSNSH